MAGIFNLDLSSIGDAVQKLGKTAVETVAGVQGKLTPEQQATLDQAVSTAQSSIDQAEANSSNLFVAGWRPAVGWICGFALAFQYLLRPLAQWALVAFGSSLVLPQIDLGQMYPILIGMLGLTAARTVEKIQGAAGNH